MHQKRHPENYALDEMSRVGRERQKRFLRFGLHVFRESLLINYGATDLVRLDGKLLGFTNKFAPFFNEVNCLRFTDEFEKAIYHIERNANPRILFSISRSRSSHFYSQSRL